MRRHSSCKKAGRESCFTYGEEPRNAETPRNGLLVSVKKKQKKTKVVSYWADKTPELIIDVTHLCGNNN